MRKGRTLEQFAKRIESHIRKSGQNEGMERLICRLLTGEDPKVAAVLAAKWVEWRYGSAKKILEVSGTIEHEHTTADPERLTDEQLAQAESLVESAYVRPNQK